MQVRIFYIYGGQLYSQKQADRQILLFMGLIRYYKIYVTWYLTEWTAEIAKRCREEKVNGTVLTFTLICSQKQQNKTQKPINKYKLYKEAKIKPNFSVSQFMLGMQIRVDPGMDKGPYFRFQDIPISLSHRGNIGNNIWPRKLAQEHCG